MSAEELEDVMRRLRTATGREIHELPPLPAMFRSVSAGESGPPVSLYIFDEIPLGQKIQASYKGKMLTKCFMYKRVRDEYPIILTNLVNSMFMMDRKWQTEDEKKDASYVVSKLNEFKSNIVKCKPLVPFTIDAIDDANAFFITLLGNTWYTAPWVLMESYFYWSIRMIFRTCVSEKLKVFDPFCDEKCSFGGSSSTKLCKAAVELAELVLNERSWKSNPERKKRVFETVLKASMWAEVYRVFYSHDSKSSADSANKFDMVVDDTDAIWSFLTENRKDNTYHYGRRDLVIVPDLAGFEVFADMCLAEFLLSAGIIKRVFWCPKSIPWHRSARAPELFMDDMATKYKGQLPEDLMQKWTSYFINGTFLIDESPFWSLPYTFDDMSLKYPSLHGRLSNVVLVILKGNYNYHKMTDDRVVHPTASFSMTLKQDIGQFMNIVSSRVLHTDLATGLSKEKFDELCKKDPQWIVRFRYGSIQFNDADKWKAEREKLRAMGDESLIGPLTDESSSDDDNEQEEEKEQEQKEEEEEDVGGGDEQDYINEDDNRADNDGDD